MSSCYPATTALDNDTPPSQAIARFSDSDTSDSDSDSASSGTTTAAREEPSNILFNKRYQKLESLVGRLILAISAVAGEASAGSPVVHGPVYTVSWQKGLQHILH